MDEAGECVPSEKPQVQTDRLHNLSNTRNPQEFKLVETESPPGMSQGFSVSVRSVIQYGDDC